MTYDRFESLPCWNEAIVVADQVFDLCEDPSFAGQGDLRSQLQRAALSVSNNIAEGFERGTTNELIAFLYVARGSAGEVRSMLCFAERRPRFAHLKSQISNLKSKSEGCSKQLGSWADYLQNTPIKGQRHHTNADREARAKADARDAFLARMRAMTAAARERALS